MGNYNLYRSRVSAYGSSIKEGRRNSVINKINDAFEDSPSYFDITINNSKSTIGVQIVDDSSSINQTNQYTKIIIMQPGDNLSTGDLIQYDSKDWLCVASELLGDIYYRGKINKCTHTLSLYKSGVLSQVPMCIESGIRLYQLGTDENKYLEVPSTIMTGRIPNTATTRQIARGDIYQIGLQNWKTTDVNDALEPGLLILKFEYSQEAQETHTYTIEITNGSTVDIQQSITLQINYNIYDNGILLTPFPPITFTSSDTDVCTVDSSGLVSALDIGSCSITVTLATDNTVFDSININVVDVPQDNYTVEITGNPSIIKDYTENYFCVFKNNGVAYTDTSVFYLTADDGVSITNLATITSQDKNENTCVVSGVGLGHVKLWVKNSAGTIVSQPLRILVENLF